MSKKAVSGARKIAQVLEDHASLCLYILFLACTSPLLHYSQKDPGTLLGMANECIISRSTISSTPSTESSCLIDQVSLRIILTLPLQLLKEQVL